MSSIVIKRQSTLKIIFKCTKSKGIQVAFSRFSGVSTLMEPKERLNYIKSEAFILPNSEILYLEEIRECLDSSLKKLLQEKGIDTSDIAFERIFYSAE